jgi:hypothetical protein
MADIMDAKKLTAILTLFCASCLTAQASHLHLEKEYQSKWSKDHNGTMEYVLDDCSRVDVLLPDYVVEFDFAPKVYESIGQAFYYASKTGRKPAVVLIIENPEKEQKYLNKLKSVSEKYGLKYWIMTPQDMI